MPDSSSGSPTLNALFGVPDAVPASEAYFDVGSIHEPITTASPDAQTWFDRALAWVYGFNHGEALYCFAQVVAHDPGCPWGWWGLAYRSGANYNYSWAMFARLGMLEKKVALGRQAIEHALRLIPDRSDPEYALILALDKLYPTADDFATGSVDMLDYCNRHVEALRPTYDRLGRSGAPAHLLFFFAEALMSVTPWKLWDLRNGLPGAHSHAYETKSILETAIAREGPWLEDQGSGRPEHPGLHHLYVHLMEMSQHPELAIASGDRLRHVLPDAAHLQHMASHIDCLVGDYRLGVQANVTAIASDTRYLARTRATDLGFSKVSRLHNANVGVYAAMFAGQWKAAIFWASQMSHVWLDKDMVGAFQPVLEYMKGVKVHVLVRFGRWNDLKCLQPAEDQAFFPYTTAMTYYGRGIAFAAMGEVAQAKAERAKLVRAIEAVPDHWTVFPTNKAKHVLQIPLATLDGETAYRDGDYASAWSHLSAAVELYDNLDYGEPWPWMLPVRHAYAALRLEQGHVEHALRLYAEDLGFVKTLPRATWHPNNVWALHGYHECLVRLGRTEEADVVRVALDYAQAIADVEIEASCFCRSSIACCADDADRTRESTWQSPERRAY